MDKRKLIGTILGVLAFAALIVGATYAWLTLSFDATNSNYNTRSKNFTVDYSNNNGSITDIPILETGSPSEASLVTVTAKKGTNSASGNLTLYLNTDTTVVGEEANTSAALLESGAIHYAVCIGTCTTFVGLTTQGTITDQTPLKYAILSNTPLTATNTEYNVYFWLDSNLLTGELNGTKYTGYISAEASQTE